MGGDSPYVTGGRAAGGAAARRLPLCGGPVLLAGGGFCFGVVSCVLFMTTVQDSGVAPVEEIMRVTGKAGLEAAVTQQAEGRVKVVVSRDTGAERERLTFAEALPMLREEEAPGLRLLLSDVLRRLPFEAYFWECPPFSKTTYETRIFEFVALSAPHLAKAEAEEAPFADHLAELAGKPEAVSFLNHRGDSVFVAPSRATEDPEHYAHIASFFRHAPEAQCDALWRALGEAVEERMSQLGPTDDVWLSAEGNGVIWVHLRVDLRPKYYHYHPYRDPEHGLAADGT